MPRRELTPERLREVLHYDPESGAFTWRVKTSPTSNRAKPGDVAGRVDGGYVVIGIDRQIYRAHRLAWLYMTGRWPEHDIDHRDTVKTNDAFDNLRAATRRFNTENRRKANANNKTGFLGVVPRRGRFRAMIKAAGRTISLGSFESAAEAHAAYVAAKRRLHEGNTL